MYGIQDVKFVIVGIIDNNDPNTYILPLFFYNKLLPIHTSIGYITWWILV